MLKAALVDGNTVVITQNITLTSTIQIGSRSLTTSGITVSVPCGS
jgi:hypothetical protein